MLAVCALLSACGADGDGARPAGATVPDAGTRSPSQRAFVEAPLRDCRSRAEPEVPETGPGPAAVRLGPAAYFPALLAVAAEVDPTPRHGRRFVEMKAVFALAAGARATLVIPPRQRARIGLEYALPGGRRPPRAFTTRNGGAAVRFAACAADEPRFTGSGSVGAWTTFNGGFFVAGPGCYPIELHVPAEGVRHRRLVSFGGGQCPG